MYIVTIVDIKQKIDASKKRIADELWLKMKISAIRQGMKIHEWLEDAIKLKLEMEERNEK